MNDIGTLSAPLSSNVDPPGMASLQDTPSPACPIGAILVERGRLSAHDADLVAQVQKERGMRFGDAAILLGLSTQDDIDLALSHQFRYAYVPLADDAVDRSLVAAYRPFSAAVEDLRALRSQLKLRWLDAGRDHRTLAIVSPGPREGRSHVAANLAIVFSQLGERTLVVDADLRQPRQRQLFKVRSPVGLSDILAGRCGLDAIVDIPSLRHLSVLPAGVTPPNPQELLNSDAFPSLLSALCQDHDVVILDTPNAMACADAYTVAQRAGAALLVTREHVSSLPHAGLVARNLQQCGATLVGCVLNGG